MAIEKKVFENNGHMHVHVYSPGAGADNPLGYICFHNHNYSVNLALADFPPIE